MYFTLKHIIFMKIKLPKTTKHKNSFFSKWHEGNLRHSSLGRQYTYIRFILLRYCTRSWKRPSSIQRTNPIENLFSGVYNSSDNGSITGVCFCDEG